MRGGRRALPVDAHPRVERRGDQAASGGAGVRLLPDSASKTCTLRASTQSSRVLALADLGWPRRAGRPWSPPCRRCPSARSRPASSSSSATLRRPRPSRRGEVGEDVRAERLDHVDAGVEGHAVLPEVGRTSAASSKFSGRTPAMTSRPPRRPRAPAGSRPAAACRRAGCAACLPRRWRHEVHRGEPMKPGDEQVGRVVVEDLRRRRTAGSCRPA